MDSGNNIEILDNGDDEFIRRHIGPSAADQQEMLNELGFQDIEQLIKPHSQKVLNLIYLLNCQPLLVNNGPWPNFERSQTV